MKKVLAMFLAFVMVLALTACVSNKPTPTVPDETTTPPITQETEPPAAPTTTQPEPTETEATEPEPTATEPTEPVPTEPEPTKPKPTQPRPTEPRPTQPEPTEPKPTDPEPTDPEPTDPEPTDPEPTDPEPTDPEPNPLLGTWTAQMDITAEFNAALQEGFAANEDIGLDYSMVVADRYWIDYTIVFQADTMTATISETAAAQALVPDLAGDFRAMLTAAGIDPQDFESEIKMSLEDYFAELLFSQETQQQATAEYMADGSYIYTAENGIPNEENKLAYTVNGNELLLDGITFTRS